jgi:hypothetical protein
MACHSWPAACMTSLTPAQRSHAVSKSVPLRSLGAGATAVPGVPRVAP